MHTPGPWRSVRLTCGDYYTHHVETDLGHVASVVGWTHCGTVCPTTEANVRLIACAPDMADALRQLLGWADRMGGWDATCWSTARLVLDRAQLNEMLAQHSE